MARHFSGRGHHNPVPSIRQGCRGYATRIITELREKFASRSLNARFMGRAVALSL